MTRDYATGERYADFVTRALAKTSMCSMVNSDHRTT